MNKSSSHTLLLIWINSFLSGVRDRQWGTVREEHSSNGDAWNHFTHDNAQYRAYRWGEDGLAGISDNRQALCFALAKGVR
jgi:hypothetical protein